MSRTRRLTVLAVFTAAAIGLTGCASSATQSASSSSSSSAGTIAALKPDQKVSIVFESYNLLQAGAWTDTVTGLIADFEKAHPNITVKAQPTQGTTTAGANTVGSVQTQMLAGNAPDVAQLTFDSLDFAVNQLGAQPLEKLVGEKAITAAFGGAHPFDANAAKLADWNGQTYGMPYVFSTPVLFYNSTELQSAGLPADPDLSTWAKVKAAAAKVTAKTGKPSLTISCAVKGGSWCMQGIFKSNGGAVLSDDRTKIEFGNPASVGAVSMLRDLNDSGVLTNLDAAGQLQSFSKGDSAFQLTTSAVQGAYMAAAKSGGWTLKDAAMPAFGSKPAVPTNSGSGLFMFSKDPAKQAASWELMKFLTSDHAYEQITTKIGYLPLRTSLTKSGGALADWAASNPLVQPNLDQLSRLQPWTSYPGNSYVQVDDILAAAIEDSVFFGKDPKTTMAAAQKRAQALIEK